ncbi:hypothetical protein [Marinobacter orientalis]|uniref:Uncharacterized protein n=1 Tax=Marinobacter orientalis TaxID=1928859 RepID=A0A7Y0WSY1_9GAMM|nr:hypothetical protein [Marinobacter orientalis]NMT64256.1 hypothetical protein [Marinobacter orientalis]TGX49478.1 hypothetical protein DIT72_11685 [Marinobacter orientalis]
MPGWRITWFCPCSDVVAGALELSSVRVSRTFHDFRNEELLGIRGLEEISGFDGDYMEQGGQAALR